jgi:glucose-6-phosphate isomerase, archaeal
MTMANRVDLSDVAGMPVTLDPERLTLDFGEGIDSAPLEQRRIDDIRQMLPNPDATGPDPLYSIYMDIRVTGLSEGLRARGLAYGAVVDSAGSVGDEYVRSQGHVHSAPDGSDVPYLELYEIWHGSGAIYLQDAAKPVLNEVYLIDVGVGDKVLIPPGWVHVVINSGPTPLAFGALYATDAVLIYDSLRALGGTAWAVRADGEFEQNPRYRNPPRPVRLQAKEYPQLGLTRDRAILDVLASDPDRYDYVVDPEGWPDAWGTVIRDLRDEP